MQATLAAQTSSPVRNVFATRPVLLAMAALAVVLLLVSPWYGYQRDELYFRLLEPAWGYVDQPPLTPLVVRGAILAFGDTLISLRIVSALFAVTSVLILALITREIGGSRFAQAVTAWGVAGASVTLMFGHVLLTATLDLVVWPAALLFVIRAVMRSDGRWWLAAAAVIGASTYNKLLIAVLLIGIAVGLATLGPWKWFASRWLWGAVLLAVALAIPNMVYQVANGFPQMAVGTAMGAVNGEQVRTQMWLYLVLMVGPVLTIFWVIALIDLFRKRGLRPLRFLAVTFVVVLAFVFYAGTQYYYPFGMLITLVAIGAPTVADWASTRIRRVLLIAALAINGVGCALASIPVLPAAMFGPSPLDAVNTTSADQVGWEQYVAQISEVARGVNADAIVASNYGEAGALDRFGVDLPPVVSGHNALWVRGGPPEDTRTIVLTSQQGQYVEKFFASCQVAGTLDNGFRVGNEEQGLGIMVCTGPLMPWADLWPHFYHLG